MTNIQPSRLGGPSPYHSSFLAPERPGRAQKRRKRVALLSVGVLAAAGLSLAVGTSASSAATVTGTMVTQNLTRAGGCVWLPGGGGNFWVSDSVLGLCETVPASLGTTKCNGTAKGGQVVYDSGKSLIYQADGTT